MARVVQQRSGPPYLLIVLVFLFFVSTALAVLFYIRNEEALEQNARVEITHGHTRQTAPGRVISVEPPGKENEPYRVTVELSVPSETFWGLSLPPLHPA